MGYSSLNIPEKMCAADISSKKPLITHITTNNFSSLCHTQYHAGMSSIEGHIKTTKQKLIINQPELDVGRNKLICIKYKAKRERISIAFKVFHSFEEHSRT